jgi:hypothetical protein
MWAKSVVEWTEGQTVFLSVPFTWLLPEASTWAHYWRRLGFEVRAGGPAIDLMLQTPTLSQQLDLPAVAQCGGSADALRRHNSR